MDSPVICLPSTGRRGLTRGGATQAATTEGPVESRATASCHSRPWNDENLSGFLLFSLTTINTFEGLCLQGSNTLREAKRKISAHTQGFSLQRQPLRRKLECFVFIWHHTGQAEDFSLFFALQVGKGDTAAGLKRGDRESFPPPPPPPLPRSLSASSEITHTLECICDIFWIQPEGSVPQLQGRALSSSPFLEHCPHPSPGHLTEGGKLKASTFWPGEQSGNIRVAQWPHNQVLSLSPMNSRAGCRPGGSQMAQSHLGQRRQPI